MAEGSEAERLPSQGPIRGEDSAPWTAFLSYTLERRFLPGFKARGFRAGESMSDDHRREAPAGVAPSLQGPGQLPVAPPDIRIVLVEPSHPGNIGAAARAMKNMGLAQLVLVRPREFPHSEAIARASGADDVLERARVVSSVQEALAGCGLVAATTSRARDQNFRVLDVREAAERLVADARLGPVAVLFGAERTGLTNEELEAAHFLVRIPASQSYLSLNLGMAVQLVTYELFRAWGLPHAAPLTAVAGAAAPLASPQEMQRLYAHLEQVLEEIDFRDRTTKGTHLMNRIRRFLQRAELDQNEVNILRGILAAVQGRRKVPGSKTDRHAPGAASPGGPDVPGGPP
jgi:TrmH family RNA methyltransferase